MILTPSDYSQLRDSLYRVGFGKEELKALSSLPDKAHIMAAFQSLEDNLVAAFPAWKADLDTALGVTTTNALAQKAMVAFFAWRVRKAGG